MLRPSLFSRSLLLFLLMVEEVASAWEEPIATDLSSGQVKLIVMHGIGPDWSTDTRPRELNLSNITISVDASDNRNEILVDVVVGTNFPPVSGNLECCDNQFQCCTGVEIALSAIYLFRGTKANHKPVHHKLITGDTTSFRRHKSFLDGSGASGYFVRGKT
eukprot:Nitzschia sp. Nitz4//scaffold269_size25945//24701//25183//NITZ4_008294-RA/size25945-processed-gene-0.29-mRNA-1//-1//CDS//3329544982//8585//frame0